MDHNSGLATYFRSHLDQWMKDWTRKYEAETGIKYNIYDDGLKIFTTIDSKLQAFAEEAVSKHMAKLQQQFWTETKGRGRDPFYKEDEQGDMVADPEYPARMIKSSQRYRDLKRAYGSDKDSINYHLNKPVKMSLFSWKGDIDTILSPMDSLKYVKQCKAKLYKLLESEIGCISKSLCGLTS